MAGTEAPQRMKPVAVSVELAKSFVENVLRLGHALIEARYIKHGKTMTQFFME